MTKATRILDVAEKGNAKPATQLLPLVYEELRKLAVHRMPWPRRLVERLVNSRTIPRECWSQWRPRNAQTACSMTRPIPFSARMWLTIISISQPPLIFSTLCD